MAARPLPTSTSEWSVPEAARVVVVDDDPLFREALVALLSTTDGIAVVGEAGDGESAVALTEGLSPDLVVMDVEMPRMGGLDATGRILERDPAIAVVVVSGTSDTAAKALQAGAVAYMRKSSDLAGLAPLLLNLARTRLPPDPPA
jgi:DNA-binding NarL/FixJ family response regulator